MMKEVKLSHFMNYYLLASSSHFLSAGPRGVQDWAHDITRRGPEACFDPTSQRKEEASSRYDTHSSLTELPRSVD